MLATIDWGAKVGFTILGLSVLAAGIWVMRFGTSITAALNKDYGRLPFHFQYPSWWHRFVGALFAALGLVVASGSIVFGWR